MQVHIGKVGYAKIVCGTNAYSQTVKLYFRVSRNRETKTERVIFRITPGPGSTLSIIQHVNSLDKIKGDISKKALAIAHRLLGDGDLHVSDVVTVSRKKGKRKRRGHDKKTFAKLVISAN